MTSELTTSQDLTKTTTETTSPAIRLSRDVRRALKRADKGKGSPRRQPKPQIKNAAEWVIEGLQPLTESNASYVVTQKIRVHGAMTTVMSGEAKKGDLDVLVAAWNICSALCNLRKYEADVMPASRAALISLCARSNKLRRVVANAEEIRQLNNLIALHDEWLDASTVRDIEQALKWIKVHPAEAIASKDIPK